MKKLLALILVSLILCGTVACSSGKDATTSTNTTETATTESTKETVAPAEITGATPSAKKAMENLEMKGFQGIAYAVKDGKVLATFNKGNLPNGNPITINTPMPIASLSKQFCAASILLLQEQGKLSIDDTIDKYYPDYKHGNKISIKHLLSMRSGIPNYTDYIDEFDNNIFEDKTFEENFALLKKWIFSKDLDFQPDENYYYSNSNYSLLSDIIEQISGKKYIDFLRKNIFEPLGMTHTGAICELDSSPDWAQGNTYEKEGITMFWKVTKGDGYLVSNGADMALWMDGLRKGKVISPESYNVMTTNYSDAYNYGYGLMLNIMDGVGHDGFADIYTSLNYINESEDLLLFMASSTVIPSCSSLYYSLILDLIE